MHKAAHKHKLNNKIKNKHTYINGTHTHTYTHIRTRCTKNQMAALCEMPTIQYSARSARLSVHKLFTSCIRRCLWMSRACDWVMSALSAVTHIYSFQFRPAFLPRLSARRPSGILGLPNIGHRTSPKIWGGFLYGAYIPEEWLWIDSKGKNES